MRLPWITKKNPKDLRAKAARSGFLPSTFCAPVLTCSWPFLCSTCHCCSHWFWHHRHGCHCHCSLTCLCCLFAWKMAFPALLFLPFSKPSPFCVLAFLGKTKTLFLKWANLECGLGLTSVFRISRSFAHRESPGSVGRTKCYDCFLSCRSVCSNCSPNEMRERGKSGSVNQHQSTCCVSFRKIFPLCFHKNSFFTVALF